MDSRYSSTLPGSQHHYHSFTDSTIGKMEEHRRIQGADESVQEFLEEIAIE